MLTEEDVDRAIAEGIEQTFWAIVLSSVLGLLVAGVIVLMGY